MNLIFCGLPGSGKTTNAKRVAEKLGWKCLETDRLLEKHYYESTGEHLSCRQLFKKIGEGKFRSLEEELLSRLVVDKTVIDIGGGTLNNSETIKILKNLGFFVYLEEKDKDCLYKRLINKGVPAYLDPSDPKGSFQKLIAKREAIYSDVADLTIDITGLTPELITEKILQTLTLNPTQG